MKKGFALLAGAVAATCIANAAAAENLRIGILVETTSVDPFWDNGSFLQQIASQIFDRMVELDHRQQPRPALAESWKAVNDTTWEFKLRKGVKFHDGSPFTADDAVFTWELVAQKGPARYVSSGPGRYLRTGGKQIKRVDDYTVQVTTDKPYPLVPLDASIIAMVSKKHGEGANPGEDYNNGKAAIGAGPYKFVEWVKGDRLVLDANPNYWRGKPRWDRVTYKPIKSDPARIAALLSANVDIIEKVPTTDIASLRKNPDIVVSESPSNRIIHLQLDSSRDLSPYVKGNDGQPLWPNPLRKWEVRKALSKAINRKAIVEQVMEGVAIPAGQVLPDGFFGVSPNLKPEPYDPEGAKTLLAQAGYPHGFQITLHGPNDRYVNDAKIVETIAQMWARIGIKTAVTTLPTSVYFTRAKALDYSIDLYGYSSDSGDASSPLVNTIHSPNREAGLGASNTGAYSNPRFDSILEQALITIDDAKREKLFQQATEIAINDVAIIPLHYQVNTWAMRKGLRYQARTDEHTLAESVERTEAAKAR